jgi:hypothetical protein
MKVKARNAAVGMLLLLVLGCRNSVRGDTYANGMMKIQFQSGMALATIGMMTQNCEWSQSSKNITLNCAGDTTQFTLGDDGTVAGRPDGMIGRLTRVKQLGKGRHSGGR